MSSRSRRTARAVGSRRTSRSAVVVEESVAGRRKAASGECMYVPEPSIPLGRSAAAAETVEETVEETAAAAAAAAVGDMARGHRCMYQVDPRANLWGSGGGVVVSTCMHVAIVACTKSTRGRTCSRGRKSALAGRATTALQGSSVRPVGKWRRRRGEHVHARRLSRVRQCDLQPASGGTGRDEDPPKFRDPTALAAKHHQARPRVPVRHLGFRHLGSSAAGERTDSERRGELIRVGRQVACRGGADTRRAPGSWG